MRVQAARRQADGSWLRIIDRPEIPSHSRSWRTTYPVRAGRGGVSTGGDIAVALAGIGQRISRVAAIAATPDWTRPGMRDIGDPSRVLPQGEPDAYAQWFLRPS